MPCGRYSDRTSSERASKLATVRSARGGWLMARRGHNEGTIVKRADGRWAAAVTLPNGKRHWVYARGRAEVAKKLAEALRAVEVGNALGDTRQTVEQYLRWWLAEQAQPTTR